MKKDDLVYRKQASYKGLQGPFAHTSSACYDERTCDIRVDSMKKTIVEKRVAKGRFVVGNDRGLHTRPSTELVRCASAFKSEVFLKYQKHAVNAKSLLGVLMLAASKGAKIGIEAEGEDAELAVESIIALAANNFYIKY